MKLAVIFFALAAVSGLAHAAPQKECFDQLAYNQAIAAGFSGERALREAMRPCGKEYFNVNISAYDCSIGTVSANKGKCRIVAVIDGKERKLTASPEVAAPWGNGYGDLSCRPMSGLTLTVTNKGEIITVKDSKGGQVTTKYDFSR